MCTTLNFKCPKSCQSAAVSENSISVTTREFSVAQGHLTNLHQHMYVEQPKHREIIQLIMTSVGCGGCGDVDEIRVGLDVVDSVVTMK